MPEKKIINTPEDVGFFERNKLLKMGWPEMAFIEKYFAGDYTNWWIPNEAAVEAMLRSAGLKIKENPAFEIYICSPDENKDGSTLNEIKASMKAINYLKRRKRIGWSKQLKSGTNRITFHTGTLEWIRTGVNSAIWLKALQKR